MEDVAQRLVRQLALRCQVVHSIRNRGAGELKRYTRPWAEAFAATGEDRTGLDKGDSAAQRPAPLECAYDGQGGGNFGKHHVSTRGNRRKRLAEVRE